MLAGSIVIFSYRLNGFMHPVDQGFSDGFFDIIGTLINAVTDKSKTKKATSIGTRCKK